MSVRPESVREDEDDDFVALKNGDKLPVVHAALRRAPRFLVEDPPVTEGRVEGNNVRVLRDTGCNTVVVKRVHAATEKLTRKFSPLLLLGSTVKYFPEAKILIDTSCTVIEKCMDNPLYEPAERTCASARGRTAS